MPKDNNIIYLYDVENRVSNQSEKESFHSQIQSKIEKLEEGSVFVTSDFSDIADVDTASRTLLRLADSGIIKRVIRGVYIKGNEKVSEVSKNAVAKAIARSNGRHIAPSLSTALYISGLSKEEPKEWTYVTDGTYREYAFQNTKIKFQHTSGKIFIATSEKVTLLIQVIKAYGKEAINSELLKKVGTKFCHGDEEKLIRESRKSTEWISRAIKDMCDLILHREKGVAKK